MLAWVIQLKILVETTGLTFRQYMVVLVFLEPVYLTLYMAFSLYTTKSVRRKQVELGKIAQAVTIGLLIFLAGMYLTRSS